MNLRKFKIENWKFWILFIFLIKIIVLSFFFFKATQSNYEINGLAIIHNDFSEFIEPCNQLLERGKYALKDSNEPYMGRLPGYGFPYLIFRLLFSEFISIQLTVLSQIILSSFAIYALGLIIFFLTNNKKYFYFIIFIFPIFFFFNKEDLFTGPASFSYSAFTLHLFFLQQYFKHKKNKYLLISGGFLTWLFFLRPFTLVFIGSLIFSITIKRNFKIKHKVKMMIFLFLPFVLCEFVWTTRNYLNTERFIPLQDSYVPGQRFDYTVGCGINCTAKYSVLEVRKLIVSWGGNSNWFIPGTEMHWFFNKKKESDGEYTFLKKNIFSKGFNKDSLQNLKSIFLASFNQKINLEERKKIDRKILQKSRKFKNIFKENHPFQFYFTSYMLRFKNFLLINPTTDWPGESLKKSSLTYKIFKFFSIVIYYIVTISVLILTFFDYKSIKKETLINYCVMSNIILIITFVAFIELSTFSYYITGFISSSIVLLFYLSNKIKTI